MVSVVTVESVLRAEMVAEGAHSIQEVVLNKNLIVNSRIRLQYLKVVLHDIEAMFLQFVMHRGPFIYYRVPHIEMSVSKWL